MEKTELPIEVQNGIDQTFPGSNVQTIAALSGGLSGSLVYKIVVDEQPYVLKLGRPSECLLIAADAHIAPTIESGKAAGLSISAFIENQPNLSLTELARTIRRIHSLPAFPAGTPLLSMVNGLISGFNATGFEECLTFYAEIRQHYPWGDTNLVPSHNDLNPGNIIFDGEKIWIIDWDAAHQNDRYVDLAIAANFYVKSEEQERVFLATYFGDDVTAYQFARFFLMRQICRIVYGTLLFDKGTLGQSLLNSALTDMRSPRFADEISRMADNPAIVA
jgi:hypothetical protein